MGRLSHLGFNKNWIVVGINMFTIQGTFFDSANLYVFDKANLYAGGSGLFTLLQDDTGGFSMNPALTYDPNLRRSTFWSPGARPTGCSG